MRPAHVVATVNKNFSQKSDRVVIQSSPLTIGSISVGVIVGILLLISLLTLIIGRVRRKVSVSNIFSDFYRNIF